MTSILDMKAGPPDYWAEISNFFLPLKYIFANDRFDALVQDIDLYYLINAVFWIFVALSFGFYGFQRMFQFFLKSSNVKYFKRKQFARLIWNIAFYAACCLFLHFYNEFMILPQLMKNQGRYALFYSSENLIFYRSHQTEKFQFYSTFIITFYLHGAMLDFKEADFLEAASKGLYLLALIAIDVYRYENYFVGLNLTLGLYSILTELLALLAMPNNSNRNRLIYQLFMGIRIAAWSHVFINLLPFKYFMPTLFAKNFKLPLNVVIWLWYGLSIWNSPVLQYFYHQIYHTTPADCSGEGSAAKCILVKDSVEYRHYKTLKKAYMEVKLAHEKSTANALPATESASAKTFQAIKCVMMLKRKLKRIREGRGNEPEDDNEELNND
ncbi:uncharacterized protein [Drosophila tropicalis]|uniref:TLC domain-containing protein n=1 Tax=Drosophila willistoni TaxID=7260 RepID=B4N1I4_DROWI|nr:uncharacterized protein LOC6644555 [Drosophila willistoni]EDW78223.1 uncharacterized protein Dwil_GK16290 [Drosophila willistoni]